MKRLVIVLVLGLLIAGSAFAQGGYDYNQTAQALQTITGTLQIINGILAIVNASNQVYYVPNLMPYYGANGLFVNTSVTVYGNIGNNNYCDPYRFMVSGTWYNFPSYNYYVPPPVYVPMYVPPPRQDITHNIIGSATDATQSAAGGFYMEECVKQAFEDAYNRILPGLQMLVRDANLAEETAAKYKPGILIRETAFCDATSRVGGMATTHRYAILTNRFLDTGKHIEDKENWGLCICQRGSRFKVLDVYRYEGKTQITLLHLDDGHGWELFQHMQSNIEDDLVKTCRERFEKKCLLPPIPEVSAQLWLERCAQPVGIDGKNEFIPLKDTQTAITHGS